MAGEFDVDIVAEQEDAAIKESIKKDITRYYLVYINDLELDKK